jgi:LicD family
MNQTTHFYSPVDGSAERQYLLDVNPHYTERTRGDGFNIIDARWIDTKNGLYIDITGLSETQPDLLPGVWSCKNDHHYKTRDLFPLRESTFEGVYALIPYSYDRILITEYQYSALVNTEWLGYVLMNLISPNAIKDGGVDKDRLSWQAPLGSAPERVGEQ